RPHTYANTVRTDLIATPSSYTLPPPPTSTLFPYTTLFRSLGKPRGERIGIPLRDGRVSEHHGVVRLNVEAPQAEIRRAGEHGERDRKSTRLNSSHVAISYAVFCLKKKKKKHKT